MKPHARYGAFELGLHVKPFALLTLLSGYFCYTLPTLAASPEELGKRFDAEIAPVLRKYCVQCHNQKNTEGGLNLDAFHAASQAVDASIWPTVIERMSHREMPPEDKPQLSEKDLHQVVSWMQDTLTAKTKDCQQLATDGTQRFYKGSVMSRRLTRTEYNNTLRDLTGIDFKLAEIFPADGAGGEGFDTHGDALFTNPILLEKYIAAADRVIETILPDETAEPFSAEIAAARKRLLIASPNETVSPSAAAEKIISAFARQAYRRPVAAEDLKQPLALFEQSQTRGKGFLPALRLALKGILVSPQFIFLAEPLIQQEGVHPLASLPLASRLSYFLWASMPDETLLTAAEADQLQQPEQLREHVHRMRQDARLQNFAESFATQWLAIDTLGNAIRPDKERYPEFDDELAQAMRQEAITFTAAIFREDRSLLEFLDADYTFVNERLARHYNLTTEIRGPKMQRISLTNRNRGGLVGMASILTATSYPLRTSPVLRGKWILSEVLGSKVPPPPPNVPSLPTDDIPKDGLTLRQRLEQHRSKAECASCHNRLDPLGFGLENFDAVGRWRTEIAGQSVDASGQLPSGEKFSSPAELKKILLARKHDFLRNFVRKTLGYALGRSLNQFDDCVVKETLAALEANNYRSSVLLEQIVLSYPFRHRFVKP